MTDPSVVEGSRPGALINSTVSDQFDDTVQQYGEREALVVRHQGIRWSYNELKKEVDTFAGGLLAAGFEPGDRLGIWSPNNAQWVVTQLATARIGVILVNINPAYRKAELKYSLNKVGCKGLVLAETFKTSQYVEMLRDLAPEIGSYAPGELQAEELPALRTLVHLGSGEIPGMYRFSEISSLGGPEGGARSGEVARTLSPDDPINIQFTSGTTGLPKGATLTHFNILNNGFFVGEGMRLGEQDRICIPVPLYHCFGMVLGNMACITHGAAMVYPDEAFDPLTVLQTVTEERCTGLYGVPTMFIAELEHPEFAKFDLSSLRTGIMAGSTCPVEVMKRCVDEMHMTDVTICYGMTETSPVSFQTAIDDPLEKRVSTVGRVHPHVEAKVVDPESGQVLPRGSAGELCSRGYLVMQGYWNDQEKTREAIDAEGWMHTGDLAIIDPEGYCNIVGRIKDMVIRGGENIYPREVEEFLYTHPDIEDVQVIGVPDEKYGEELCAWIKLRGTAELADDAIREFCKEQIAHYKIPRYIKFVDEFPMTVTGKVQKFKMREQMEQEIAGQ